MNGRKNVRALVLGLVVSTLGLLTAWAVNRPPDVAAAGAGSAEVGSSSAATTASSSAEVTWDLPVTWNDRVGHWVDFLSGEKHDRTKRWLERSGKYVPMIRRELAARGMPQDLIYLAFIESGYSPNAYSSAKAAGLWQFIAETGRRYGLTVNSYVDERRDPVKATGAALDFLQKLHDRFGSWYLAAAAYNTGPNRVARVLDEHAGGARGSDSLYWKIAPYLPQETRDYVPLMLAAGHIGKQPAKYGFDDVEYAQALSYDSVRVPGRVALSTVAKAAGVSKDSVEGLNPELVRGVTPPEGYEVRLPRGTERLYAVRFPALQRTVRLAAARTQYHRVRRGDTLSELAQDYSVTVTDLRRWNDLGNSSRILVGQRLRVGA